MIWICGKIPSAMSPVIAPRTAEVTMARQQHEKFMERVSETSYRTAPNRSDILRVQVYAIPERMCLCVPSRPD
jgi:hypothetical protein